MTENSFNVDTNEDGLFMNYRCKEKILVHIRSPQWYLCDLAFSSKRRSREERDPGHGSTELCAMSGLCDAGFPYNDVET